MKDVGWVEALELGKERRGKVKEAMHTATYALGSSVL